MPYPRIYKIEYDYTSFQQAQQGISAFPGTQLDNDLNGLQNSVSSLALFVTGVLRSDGSLNNGIVSYDTLTPALQTLLRTAGISSFVGWLTGVSFSVGDNVIENASIYRCAVDHTSSVFAADLAAGYWTLIGALPTAPASSSGVGVSVKAYGASGSSQQTTGTIIAGSKTLALASAIDFVNGQGVLVFGAGPAPTVGAPAPISINAIHATGATTYAYKFASRDNAGGMTAATGAASISNGYATLGFYLPDLGGIAMNQLQWTNGSGSPLGTVIWRSINGGAYVLLGCFIGTSIFDTGLPTQTIPGIPATPPASAVNDWLPSVVFFGGGATSIGLANPAATSAAGAAVIHDDTIAINAAMAVNVAIAFPDGNYNVRGLQIPSTVRSVIGAGSGASVITSFAKTADGLGAGVSAAMGGAEFSMSGVKIASVASMAYDGFVLYQGAKAKIRDCEFAGSRGLVIQASADTLVEGCYVSSWWDIGIFDISGTNTSILGNRVGPITGQVGTFSSADALAGSGYPYSSGIWTLSSGHLVADNTVTPYGGCFGIASQGPNGQVLCNRIMFTGREGIVIGGNTGKNFKASGNDIFWLPAGNGNMSSGDFGMSTADDGVNAIANGDISNNKITNSAFASIAIVGSGIVGSPYTNVSIAGNALIGSNQLAALAYGIYLSGSNVSGILVGTNYFHSPSANMTYNVGETDFGNGVPTGNTIDLQIGPPGSAGVVSIGGGSNYLGNLKGPITSIGNTTSVGAQTGTGSVFVMDTSPTIKTPQINFGAGAPSGINVLSINPGFPNAFRVANLGSASNSGTIAASGVSLLALSLGYLQMVVAGGTNPQAQLAAGDDLTGGFNITAGANVLSLTNATATTTPAANNNSLRLATTQYLDRLLGTASGVATLDGGGKLSASQIPASLLGAVVYQGTWNATTNSLTLASGVGTKGWYYKVGTAGSTSIDGISQWNVGDTIIFDGTTWDKIDGVANEVISVAGLFGIITSAALKTVMSFVVGDLTDASANARTFMQAANYAAMKALLSLVVSDIGGFGAGVAAALGNALNGAGGLVGFAGNIGAGVAATAAVDTNTTQIATTAMVLGQAAAATPLGNNPTAVVGISTRFARADHVHPGREVLTAARNYYVLSSGNDSNTGLVNTAGGAFLTLQAAWNTAAKLDASIYNITINIGTGTFAPLNITTAPLGGLGVIINGNGSANTTVASSAGNTSAIAVGVPVSLTIQNLAVAAAGDANSHGLVGSAPAQITLGADVAFGTVTGGHMRLMNSCHMLAIANYKITGNFGFGGHVKTESGGVFEGYALTVTITGSPVWPSAFVLADTGSTQIWYSFTFSGASTGVRYLASLGGQLQTFGGGANYFPGNSAGSSATGYYG
jgi:hypothetical protein